MKVILKMLVVVRKILILLFIFLFLLFPQLLIHTNAASINSSRVEDVSHNFKHKPQNSLNSNFFSVSNNLGQFNSLERLPRILHLLDKDEHNENRNHVQHSKSSNLPTALIPTLPINSTALNISSERYEMANPNVRNSTIKTIFTFIATKWNVKVYL